MLAATEGHWDIVVTSLQDICNTNESSLFNNLYGKYATGQLPADENELQKLRTDVLEHRANVGQAKRLVDTARENLATILAHSPANALPVRQTPARNNSVSSKGSAKQSGKGGSASKGASTKKNNRKHGSLYYTSKFNPLEPVSVLSEVAYKLRNRHFEEWIQCEVMKVIGDGTKFEIRDPEPDENNNPGQTFKATYKEILLIPRVDDVPTLKNYPYGTKVLARYPETTTFYPALVVGERKGNVRLKFDGEEEVNKETEVERRLVLPFPEA